MGTLQFTDLRAFQSSKFESGHPIIDGFVNTGERIVLTAKQKAGKTILCLQASLCVANGVSLAGMWTVPRPRKVLYVATEGSQAELQAVLARLEAR